MAVFKCKMCGADLQVNFGDKIVECEYCGTSQTVSTTSDEKVLKLIARGNMLRQNNEFDKAYSVFEQLVSEDGADAESYWNLLLCKYGITYVDDYNGKKKPTINRMSLTSILDDTDYKKVLELADVVSKNTYIEQASEIANIQNKILDIIKQEQPYDIFISYKETDEFGDRTSDSVLAQDIYNDLVKEGYRVFLSRVSLSNSVGQEYEPVIYSALHTSKMMLLVTTSEEYVNSVWVKNEWSRFLGMMKNDSSKKLIPCYKDMDPYDLPKEIKNIQAIDFNKLGAIQDLIIGVNKVFGKSQNVTSSNKNNDESNYVSNLLKRVEMNIQEDDIEKANENLEKIFDFDIENDMAYLYQFLIDSGVKNESEINVEINNLDLNEFCNIVNTGLNSYRKMVKFAKNERVISFIDKVNEKDRLFKAEFKKKSDKVFNETNRENSLFKDRSIAYTSFYLDDDSCFKGEMLAVINEDKTVSCYPNDEKVDVSNFTNIRSIYFNSGSKYNDIYLIGVTDSGDVVTSKKLPDDYVINKISKLYKVKRFYYVYSDQSVFIDVNDCLRIMGYKNDEYINSLDIKVDEIKTVKHSFIIMQNGRLYCFSDGYLSSFSKPLENVNDVFEEWLYFKEGLFLLSVVDNEGTVTYYVDNNKKLPSDVKLENYTNVSSVFYVSYKGYDKICAINNYGIVQYPDSELEEILKPYCDKLVYENYDIDGNRYEIKIDNSLNVRTKKVKENGIVGNKCYFLDQRNVIDLEDWESIQNGIEAFKNNRNNPLLYSKEELTNQTLTIELEMNVFQENKYEHRVQLLCKIYFPKGVSLIDKSIVDAQVYVNAHLNYKEIILCTSSKEKKYWDNDVLCLEYNDVCSLYTKIYDKGLEFESAYVYCNFYGINQYIIAGDKTCVKLNVVDKTNNNASPTSNTNKTSSSSGCYTATCVYNSYDCPQVWILRRYRDNYLDNRWWGRLFIRFYYAISPTLVKYFGKFNWFRKPIKRILDKKIIKLKEKGYEDSPYKDKY